MSLEVPLLIQEKIDYYLYFRVWRNLIRAVNLEYDESSNKYSISNNYINLYGFRIKLCNYAKKFNYRDLCYAINNKHIYAIWSYRDSITRGLVPKHYVSYHIEEEK